MGSRLIIAYPRVARSPLHIHRSAQVILPHPKADSAARQSLKRVGAAVAQRREAVRRAEVRGGEAKLAAMAGARAAMPRAEAATAKPGTVLRACAGNTIAVILCISRPPAAD